MDTLREQWRDIHWGEIITQHSVDSIKKSLDGIFLYTDVKHGKNGQGDIVIINLKPTTIPFEEYFNYTHWVDKIETKGIYTNIYWNREFFTRTTKYINS